MAENDRFDPMVLESGLRYYQETRETTPLVVRAEADVVEDVLNPPSEALKKRKKWSDEETDLVLEAWDSSRSENEPLWKGVAKAVPGTTELECRRRVETLKKSCNKVKEYCDKEGKGFAELNDADFARVELAARITERWYTRIRDHCPPRPTKKSRGLGSCSSSDVATMRGHPCVGESSTASIVVVVETTWSSDFGVDVSMVWIIQLRTMGNGSVGKRRPSEFGNTNRQSR